MRPNFGKIVSVDNKTMVEVDDHNQYDYKYTGNTVVMNDIRCAVFTDDRGHTYAQPWAISGRFKRKGEKNIGAKLTTDQVKEMVVAFVVDKTPVEDIATKYNMSKRQTDNIVQGHAWRHITQKLILDLIGNKTSKVYEAMKSTIAASNKPKGKAKLSPQIIPFIVKDKLVNKLPTNDIAKKYCVSPRHIRRIVAKEKAKNVSTH